MKKKKIKKEFFPYSRRNLTNEFSKVIEKNMNYNDLSFLEKIVFRIVSMYTKSRIALKIALIYLVIGVLWIVFSDSILATLVSDAEKLSFFSVLKGWAYVIATSLILLLIVSKNINEIEYSNQKFREIDKSFKLATNIARDGIWYWNTETNQGVFSERWAEMLGLPNKEIALAYDEWIEFIHPDDRKMVRKAHEDYIEQKSPTYETEYRIMTKDGNYKWFLSRARAAWDEDGNVIYMAGSNTDITDQKNLQQELERKIEENKKLLNEVIEYDKLRTEFFSNISHELRTPLNVIYSTLQLIDFYYREDKIIENYDKMNRYIKIMKQNCYRQLRLINNLIDITRIDSGYLKMSLGNYDIVQIVESIANSVGEYIKNNNILFEFNTNVKEKIIACDEDKIERIILNLLSNAVKFTPSGGNIKVNILDKGDIIIISVKDNGIGIPRDKQDIIFERFRQADNLFTRDYEGSGIGLSLVKSLVEKHDGKIYVRSELGKGSEFYIELPAQQIPDENISNTGFDESENIIDIINVEFSDIYIS